MRPPIDIKRVTEIIPVHRATIYKLIREAGFPEPTKLGTRSLWDEDEVLAWWADHRRREVLAWWEARRQGGAS